MANITFIAAIILAVTTLAYLFLRKRARVTEYEIALLAMILTILLYLRPQISIDLYGRTHYFSASPQIAFAIFGLTFAFVAGSFLVRQQERAVLIHPEVYLKIRIKMQIIQSICVLLCAISLFLTYRRIGTVPLLALINGNSMGRIGYAQVYAGGIEYAMARGAARAGVLVLIMAYYFSGQNPLKFLKKNPFLSIEGIFCVFVTMVDGQRTQAVYPVLSGIFAAGLLGRFKWRWGVIAFLFGFAFIIVIGQLRTKHQIVDNPVELKTGIESLDTSIRWVVLYHEPSIYNLVNLSRLNPAPAFGLVWARDIVPDRIFDALFDPKPSAPLLLSKNHMYAQPGLTFRTVLGDLLPDFGLGGALLVFFAVVLCAVAVYVRARSSLRFFWWYLCIAPGIAFAPFINMYAGFPFLLPLVVGFFLPNPPVGRARLKPRIARATSKTMSTVGSLSE